MNNTITLSQLITRLAASTGVDNNNARRFLRSFFATVEDALANGETVSIKGIGTFRAANNDLTAGKLSVSYTPDETIAKELNRPFEMFEAVELADDVNFTEQDEQDNNTTENTIDLNENLEVIDVSDKLETIDVSDRIETVDVGDRLEAIEDTANTTDKETEEPVQEYSEEKVDNLADRVKTILWPEEEEEESAEIPTYTHSAKPKVGKEFVAEEPKEEIDEANDSNNADHKKLWIWGAIAVVAVSLVAYLAAVFTTPVDPIPTDVDTIQEIPDMAADVADNTLTEVRVEDVQTATPEPAAATPAPQAATPAPKDESQPTTEASGSKKEPVYDTVEISLIRLAKKHYGEGSYWVFIYEANRDIISNPNRIRPGQKVVIPDRSTFPGNNIAETKAIAKQKQSEILNKFK